LLVTKDVAAGTRPARSPVTPRIMTNWSGVFARGYRKYMLAYPKPEINMIFFFPYLSAKAPQIGAINADPRNIAPDASPDHVARLSVTSIDFRKNGINGVTSVNEDITMKIITMLIYKFLRQYSKLGHAFLRYVMGRVELNAAGKRTSRHSTE